MTRLMTCSILCLLAACASKNTAPKQAAPAPVVEVQSVPAATAAEGAVATKVDEPAARKAGEAVATPSGEPTATKKAAAVARSDKPVMPVPALLQATDRRIASMNQQAAGAESGQLWVIVDAQVEGPDMVADEVGAASFGRPDMADEGTWAVGCARLRSDLIGSVAVPADSERVLPTWEVVPGTLVLAGTEAEARRLRNADLGCS